MIDTGAVVVSKPNHISREYIVSNSSRNAEKRPFSERVSDKESPTPSLTFIGETGAHLSGNTEKIYQLELSTNFNADVPRGHCTELLDTQRLEFLVLTLPWLQRSFPFIRNGGIWKHYKHNLVETGIKSVEKPLQMCTIRLMISLYKR